VLTFSPAGVGENGARRRAEPDAGQGAEVRLEGFEPPTNGLEGRRSSSELQAPERRVARRPVLLHELRLGLGIRGVPVTQVEIELHAHAAVPDR
jgi:hypothetical protein